MGTLELEGSRAGRNFGRKTDRGTLNYRGAVFTVVKDQIRCGSKLKKKERKLDIAREEFLFLFTQDSWKEKGLMMYLFVV